MSAPCCHERLDELEVGDQPGRDRCGVIEAQIRSTRPDQLMQCGPALVHPRIRVGALLEQPDPEVVVRVECCQGQRAHDRSATWSSTSAPAATSAPSVSCWLWRTAKSNGREPTVGPRVQVGTCVNQCLCRRRVALNRRPHQRGLLSPPLTGIDVGTVFKQHLRLRPPDPPWRSASAETHPPADQRFGSAPASSSSPSIAGAAVRGGHQHGCRAVAVRDVGASAGGAADSSAASTIVAMGRPVQRGRPVNVRCSFGSACSSQQDCGPGQRRPPAPRR